MTESELDDYYAKLAQRAHDAGINPSTVLELEGLLSGPLCSTLAYWEDENIAKTALRHMAEHGDHWKVRFDPFEFFQEHEVNHLHSDGEVSFMRYMNEETMTVNDKFVASVTRMESQVRIDLQKYRALAEWRNELIEFVQDIKTEQRKLSDEDLKRICEIFDRLEK